MRKTRDRTLKPFSEISQTLEGTKMQRVLRMALIFSVLLLAFLAGFRASGARNNQNDSEVAPVAYAWGSRLSVYYPAQEKLYVYSELGGNCMYAYTLTTPGGAITRDNCRIMD